jgi:hypothetical protein
MTSAGHHAHNSNKLSLSMYNPVPGKGLLDLWYSWMDRYLVLASHQVTSHI